MLKREENIFLAHPYVSLNKRFHIYEMHNYSIFVHQIDVLDQISLYQTEETHSSLPYYIEEIWDRLICL